MNHEFAFSSLVSSMDTFNNNQVKQINAVNKLLTPRFKVIADYPYSEFKIGDVVNPVGAHKIEHYRSYSHLFRELKWYQSLDPALFPSHVKSSKYNIVAKVVGNEIVDGNVTLEDYTGSVTDFPIKDFVPATEFEFDKFKKSKTHA